MSIATWVYNILTSLSGDVQFNPGPKNKSDVNFSMCHWNLNSVAAHNYDKVFLLKAYIAVYKFDIIFTSETYLDTSIISDDGNLKILGYNLIWSDHPSNSKRGGGVYLQESISFELKIGDKLCNFISLYRSPSQTQDEFEKFSENLERNLDRLFWNNPFLVVVIEDFNVKSSNWYYHDKSSSEGNAVDTITKQYGLHQVIKEPTHILDNSSTCIDLIFTLQPNLIIESGIHPSLHPNSHHQIVYAKFNLLIHFPPHYSREVWHYKDANTELIKRAIKKFDWQRAFLNTSVNEKVAIFNNTVLNILSNFIPHETIVCDDKDPPWFNNKIKALIQAKNTAFNSFRKNSGNSELKRHLVSLQERVKASIESSKQKYYYRIANKLNNTQKNSKSYWSLLKIFLNNKKIPLIPPLFHENRFIIDFKEKAELFNSFFSKQCSLITNNSKLPTSPSYLTEKHLTIITFSAEDIGKIIRSLNPNKAHGHDNLSVLMLILCGDAICEPLQMIFNQALISGSFPCDWKKANIVPLHKKGDKQTLKNYRPVSLLPICGKIFERLIFNEMFRFFLDHKMITTNQSGFKPGGSCINELLSITHEIYKSFDDGLDVRSVFLDISKAFDEVWHEGVIFKLKQNGISGDLLNIVAGKKKKKKVIRNKKLFLMVRYLLGLVLMQAFRKGLY